MNSQYQIWLYNKAQEPVLLAQDFIKLEYAQRINEVGTFELTLPGDAIPTTYTDLTDWQLVVWRQPSATVRYIDFAGFVRSWDRYHDGNLSRIVLRGPDYNDLLDRRIVAYKSTSAQADKSSDQADDMAKAVVRENLGASATDTDRRITSYGFSVQADASTCTPLSKGMAYRNVLTTLQEIAKSSLSTVATAMFFGVVPLGDGTTMEFRTNAAQWGNDHRYPSGSSGPVVFALERGNMSNPKLAIDRREEITVVYGGGKGEGLARYVVEVEDTARAAESLFNRREGFYDGRMSENASVSSAARSLLEKGQPSRRFSYEVQDSYTSTGSPSTVYGLHWHFGDRVTGSYSGAQYDLHAAAVAITVDNYGEVVTAVLEEIAEA